MNSQVPYVTYRAPQPWPTFEQRQAARARWLTFVILLVAFGALGFGWWHARHSTEHAGINWGYLIAFLVGPSSILPAIAWWAFQTRRLTAAMLRPGGWMQEK